MTCRHQLFSRITLRTLAIGAAIFLAQLFTGAEALAKAQPPELAAAQFYRWYLQSLALNQVPLRQSPVQMSTYVSQGLIGELKRRMSRKGLRADYFIQAQESMGDWTTDIRAVKPRILGNMATVLVVLGATQETRRRLALTLILDGGEWKIWMVRLA